MLAELPALKARGGFQKLKATELALVVEGRATVFGLLPHTEAIHAI